MPAIHNVARKAYGDYTFRRRVAPLLAIEGWYTVNDKRFKVSCRHKDILRASQTRHFFSCFRLGGEYASNLPLRCVSPIWAVVYLPDRSGDFKARAFLRYNKERTTSFLHESEHYVLYRMYGNNLSQQEVCDALAPLDVRMTDGDSYL